MIDKSKHYFVRMRPLNTVPIIGWSYTSSSDKEKWVECEIVEDRYKVSDGYKVTVKSIEEGYGWEHYYQSDFESLVDDGYIIEKTSDGQHVKMVVWESPLTPYVNVRHQAYMVTK